MSFLHVGRNASALDPIGLNPLVPLLSLHNVVFFIACTLHLDEILLSKRSSKCKSLQFLTKKRLEERDWVSNPECRVCSPSPYPQGH